MTKDILRVIAAAAVILAAGCATATKTAPEASAEGEDILSDLFGPKPTLTDKQLSAIDAEPFASAKNPVKADMPAGQREYLARLKCPDGQRPEFHRGGSVGIGPYGRMIDVYVVKCSSFEANIYMDMYHPGYREHRAPEGFTIDPPPTIR